MKRCASCKRDLPLSVFRGKSRSCRWCRDGLKRYRELAANRPHLRELRGAARECVLAWETARVAFCRAFEPYGVRVQWRGFRPSVLHVPIPPVLDCPAVPPHPEGAGGQSLSV